VSEREKAIVLGKIGYSKHDDFGKRGMDVEVELGMGVPICEVPEIDFVEDGAVGVEN
jgi:hypothetical protein